MNGELNIEDNNFDNCSGSHIGILQSGQHGLLTVTTDRAYEICMCVLDTFSDRWYSYRLMQFTSIDARILNRLMVCVSLASGKSRVTLSYRQERISPSLSLSLWRVIINKETTPP